MNLVWDYYWPVAVLGAVIGAIAGLRLLRPGTKRARLRWALSIGLLLLAAAGWHALHAAPALGDHVENRARTELSRLEMERIAAGLERGPLSRTLVLSGTADDFQRRELARLLGSQPGVREVVWEGGRPTADIRLPLLVEAELLAMIGFLVGLTLAYVYELRRRARAEWGW